MTNTIQLIKLLLYDRILCSWPTLTLETKKQKNLKTRGLPAVEYFLLLLHTSLMNKSKQRFSNKNVKRDHDVVHPYDRTYSIYCIVERQR